MIYVHLMQRFHSNVLKYWVGDKTSTNLNIIVSVSWIYKLCPDGCRISQIHIINLILWPLFKLEILKWEKRYSDQWVTMIKITVIKIKPFSQKKKRMMGRKKIRLPAALTEWPMSAQGFPATWLFSFLGGRWIRMYY